MTTVQEIKLRKGRKPSTNAPLWLGMCLLAILPLLLNYAWLLHNTLGGVRSGDPLHDALSAASIRLLRPERANLISGDIHGEQRAAAVQRFTSGLLAALPEERWGNDPRWWELRCLLSAAPARAAADAANADAAVNESLRELEQLRVAPPSPALSYALMSRYRRQWFVDTYWHELQLLANPASSREQHAAVGQRVEQKLESNHGVELRELWIAAHAADPANAYSLYAEAEECLRSGEDARALELIRAGNRRPHCVEPRLFPLDRLRAELESGRFTLDARCNDLLFDCEMSCRLRVDPIPDDIERVATAAAEVADLDTINALHRYLCRIGATEAFGWADALIESIDLVAIPARDGWPEGSALLDLPNLASLRGTLLHARQQEWQSWREYAWPVYFARPDSPLLNRLLDPDGASAYVDTMAWRLYGLRNSSSVDLAAIWSELGAASYRVQPTGVSTATPGESMFGALPHLY